MTRNERASTPVPWIKSVPPRHLSCLRSSVLHILERFQQDEFATDVIDRGILQSLREENSKESAQEISHVRGAYSSPSDADILHKVIGHMLKLMACLGLQVLFTLVHEFNT